MSLAIILGCGPAGLVAAKAAADSGYASIIISKTLEPSKLFGCQYLHAPIPGYEDVPKARVDYRLIGVPEEYRNKVYGTDWDGRVSPEDFIGEHDAWDIRETYARLWADFIRNGRTLIAQGKIDSLSVPGLEHLKPDSIISTVPAPDLCCDKGHKFSSHRIWADGNTSQDTEALDNNSIVCDGTAAHEWYRISNVFGYRTIEWPDQPMDPRAAVQVFKPLATDCDCWPDIVRVGRYGTWQKSYLVHQVYTDVTEALKQ